MLVLLSFFLELPLVREPPNPQRYSSLIGFAREEKKAKPNNKPIESKGQIEIHPELTSDHSLFVYAIRSPVTREYYLRRLRRFFDLLTLPADLDVLLPAFCID